MENRIKVCPLDMLLAAAGKAFCPLDA